MLRLQLRMRMSNAERKQHVMSKLFEHVDLSELTTMSISLSLSRTEWTALGRRLTKLRELRVCSGAVPNFLEAYSTVQIPVEAPDIPADNNGNAAPTTTYLLTALDVLELEGMTVREDALTTRDTDLFPYLLRALAIRKTLRLVPRCLRVIRPHNMHPADMATFEALNFAEEVELDRGDGSN